MDDVITKTVEATEYVDGNVLKEENKTIRVYDELEVKYIAVKDDIWIEKEVECEHEASEEIAARNVVENENNVAKVTYEEFKKMSPAEKANALGIKEICSIEEIYNQIKSYLTDSSVGFDEIIDETQEVYKELQSNLVKERAREIAAEIKAKGMRYQNLTNKEKARLFQFTTDNKYNLELHMAVLKECGVELDFDEVYEDYQGIYEKMMEEEN